MNQDRPPSRSSQLRRRRSRSRAALGTLFCSSGGYLISPCYLRINQSGTSKAAASMKIQIAIFLINLMPETGVEPAISCFRRTRPLHLAHFPIFNWTERSAGFEPARPGWEPGRLPLTSRTPLSIADCGLRNGKPENRLIPLLRCLPICNPQSAIRNRPVPAAGVEPAPPRFQHGASTVLASPGNRPVPRQGIEPCICRLKAGGFAIEQAKQFERGATLAA